MIWLGATDLKEALKFNLSPYFKEIGFQFKSGFNGTSIGFKERSKEDYFFLWFGTFSTGKVILNPICGYLENIERLLFNVRLPDKSVQYYYNKPFNPLIHITLVENNNYRDKLESKTLYTSKDVEDFCEQVKIYFELKGKPFIERNNSLNKVYNQIIYSCQNGNLDPLLQHSDQFFKATIILKLMQDSKIEDYKKEFQTKLALYQNPEAWLKSFHDLCHLLDSDDFVRKYR